MIDSMFKFLHRDHPILVVVHQGKQLEVPAVRGHELVLGHAFLVPVLGAVEREREELVKQHHPHSVFSNTILYLATHLMMKKSSRARCQSSLSSIEWIWAKISCFLVT